jgi:membrane protein DedA with SNARE-associated domain
MSTFLSRAFLTERAGSLLLLLAQRSATRQVRHWFYTLGGIGLIPLGILDSSLIPIPGSLDAMTIVLAARQSDLWPYYAFMAVVGSVFGAYLTYRLAQKRGRQILEKKLSEKNRKRVDRVLKRWGFWAIATCAVLPPPTPMTPFIVAAGATDYSRNSFLGSFAVGRAIRYLLLAFLGAKYGRQVLRILVHHEREVVYALIALVVLIAAGVAIYWSRRKSEKRKSTRLARAH